MERVGNEKAFHKERVIKRLITVLSRVNIKDLPVDTRNAIESYIFSENILADSSEWYLKNILKIARQLNKETYFLTKLQELIPEVSFNSYHYNLKKFYTKNKINFDEEELDREIEQRKVSPLI